MAAEAKRQLKVFLCHASGDKPPVRELYRRLVAEGVDAWLDQEKLLPGQDWRVEIPRAVSESDVVVICLSNKSITKEGYIQKEIRFALDSAEEKPEGTIFLIPARLEDCVVPERLNRWQWVDLYEENGFIKLLRSLKLRANAVGAVIDPISYEDTDEERKRRLDQLYTEGLAAFYTEDWDKACRRFQTILSEQPNHRNAAEKLEEAENQRLYANLYAQATEAYQSEKWQLAMTALEELLQKAADYKDAVQLLRDARKREQLTELYAEARALHAARQWPAVVRVFEQIAVIEPNYPDADGLLAIAQKEVAELERLAQLNKQYSLALREMDSGNWHEARTLLEQVLKTQTGFLDTERLLRKAENEILKLEELNRRNIEVNTLYEQVQKLVRSKNWQKSFDTIEKIQKLDDQFVDQEEIFERVRTELDREAREAQRQRELDALYAEAVSLLEAKKYQEALEKWNALQTIDPTYKDVSRVKKIAKRKLDELARPEATGQVWPKIMTGWLEGEANIPANREILSERYLLLSFASLVVIVVFHTAIVDLLQIRELSVGIRLLSYSLVGALYGSVVAFALNKTIHHWFRKQSLVVIAGWMLSHTFTWIFWEYYFARAAIPTTLLLSFSTAAVTVAAIKWARPATRPVILILIFASWMLAWQGGSLLGFFLQRVFNNPYIWAIVDPLTILMGLLFTFGLQVERSWEVLRTAFWGILGFAFGNYLVDTVLALLSSPMEIGAPLAFTLWGLIGGAILEAPSRDARRMLFSAAICGIGLLVGSFAALDVVPVLTGQYANSMFLERDITLRQPFLGIGLGLAFGLLIRRISAIGVLAILGVGIYMITRALNADVFDLPSIWEAVVRGGLIGLVLGYGFGYMRNAKPLDSKPPVAKAKLVWIAIIGFLAITIPVVIRLLSPPPFTSYRWDFDNSAEGWGDYHDIAIGIPQAFNGSLRFKSTGDDPSFESPASLVIPASNTPVITVRMRIIQGQGTVGQIFFLTDQDSNWDESKSVVFILDQDGTFQTYNILMSENPAWRGTVTKIRLDPVNDPTTINIQFAIDYISVHAP